MSNISGDLSKYDVLCVGIPKSGTNMTEKVCKLLGVSPSPHMHTANYHLAETHKVAYVYRNPRNVLISAQRYQNHQMRGWEDTITDQKLINQFFEFFNAPLNSVYLGYEKWLTSKAYCFKFEDMVKGIGVVDLSSYLGVKFRPDIAARLAEGGTPTWTGKLSHWQDFWTPAIDKVWVDEGMLEIEKRLGYDN